MSSFSGRRLRRVSCSTDGRTQALRRLFDWTIAHDDRATITETDFVVHAGHSGDFFPHHLDAEFAKTTPFGQRIAHGTMTFTIGIGLTATVINPAAFTYGYERLRFPKPVFIGDTIHSRITISGREEDPKRKEFGRVTEKVEVLNQRGECVMACEHVLLVKKAAQSPPASS